jgi:uncharacterized membrane protein YeiH
MTIDSLGQHTLMLLELLATAAFALSGVMSALRKRFEPDAIGLGLFGATGLRCLSLWRDRQLPSLDP